ncbi:S66 family peptidase [Ruminococcus flavefaciens]|uniref:S66 family peptidase n=1 Tax=Ruminococcus flavefaciens TaxID=1265 RepID=UPI000467848B|nr:S66 peptidase family protein [Ruminococcus flavefaciens]
MIYPQPLKKGDKVAVICLSSGIIGEPYCAHEKELGLKKLREFGLEPVFTEHALMGTDYIMSHPEARAADLKSAFLDDSVKGIITSIGGIETFRTFPYLMEDEEFINAVRQHPKFFLGFSDTTNNHFMFHRLGLQTFYGQAFMCDLAELSGDMLPYSKAQFESCFKPYHGRRITPSDVWYEERTDFSAAAVGTTPVSHKEEHGYELLQGAPVFEGELLGGCIDSMGEMLMTGNAERYGELLAEEFEKCPRLKEDLANQSEITRRYNIFPTAEEWRGKILFAETSEVMPTPEMLREYLEVLRAEGVFGSINGIIIGKPMNEKYYDEYKSVWREAVDNSKLPILYNVNFGHSAPRAILPYGAMAHVDAEKQEITLL